MTILSRLTRTQRVALFLFFALLMNSLVRAATGYFLGRIGTAVLVVVFLVVLTFAVLPPIVRSVTWRVRNRLFVTYFLVGVLPIILILLFVQVVPTHAHKDHPYPAVSNADVQISIVSSLHLPKHQALYPANEIESGLVK